MRQKELPKIGVSERNLLVKRLILKASDLARQRQNIGNVNSMKNGKAQKDKSTLVPLYHRKQQNSNTLGQSCKVNGSLMKTLVNIKGKDGRNGRGVLLETRSS